MSRRHVTKGNERTALVPPRQSWHHFAKVPFFVDGQTGERTENDGLVRSGFLVLRLNGGSLDEELEGSDLDIGYLEQ